MPTAQGVELRRSAGGGDPAHPPARPTTSRRQMPRIGLFLGVLVLGFAAGLQAQSRGDMQVGAQVLLAGPSQAALASALYRPVVGSPGGLAEISRDRQLVVPDSAGVALRPRAIITIAFLRN